MSRQRLTNSIPAVGLGLAVVATGVQGSGFMVPESSVAGVSLANALVANPAELGAIAYNPAAMAFHTQSAISAAALLLLPDAQVTTASGTHASEGEDRIFVPALQGMYKINSDWSLGLTAGSQFGLETYWPVGTFPGLSTAIPTGVAGLSLPAGTFHPTQSKLEVASYVPSVAYRVNPNLGVSLGADLYDVRKVAFNTGAISIRGKEGDGLGWNLGLMYNSGPLTLGASYHSAVTLEGVADLTTASPVLSAIGLGSQAISSDLNLPWRLQLGVRYAINERLAAELDFNRTGWSEFEKVEFKSKDTGTTLSSSTNNWKDSNAYRLGLTYNLTDATQLRLGYSYDESCQNDSYFSARIPDSDRHLFSVGVAQRLGDGWQAEAGYMYVQFKDKEYRSSKGFNPAASRDPNGTSALNGDYETHVQIVGIGVSKSF